MRNRRVAMVTAGALVLSGVVAVSGAMASDTPPFTVDGALVPDVGASNFPDPSGNAQELGPVNSNGTKLGVIHLAPPPMLATTNPNAQVDLRNVWLDTKKDSDGEDWLYFAWERDSNRGSGVIMYEFQQNAAPVACAYATASEAELIASCNPWANRSDGDFILVWDQQGQTINIIKRTFTLVGGSLVLDAGVTVSSNAAVSADGFRGEAAVNLTDTIFAGVEECLSIANVIPGTVTGNSDTADYKDTVFADIAGAVTISNCGRVTIDKVTASNNDTDQFTWALDRSGGEDINYEGDTSASDSITSADDPDAVEDLIAGTDYRLGETDPGPQYALTSIECVSEDGESTWSMDAQTLTTTFDVVAGETTACTITNTLQPGTLTVEKTVVNDNGGTKSADDFSFTLDGGEDVAFEADGSNVFDYPAGTVVDVVENADGAYDTTYGNSQDDSADCQDLTVPAGGNVTCTITNDDKPGTLIVKKVVINDTGGTKTAADFAFKYGVSADPTVFGSSIQFEADAQNDETVDAGTYDVEEVDPLGYTVSYENCSDVVVPNGGSATCTITNTFPKASVDVQTVQTWVVKDTATLVGLRTGAPDADDATVTFRLFDSLEACQAVDGEPVGEEVVTGITSDTVATVDGVAVDATGTYYWLVSYSGDAYNDGSESGCGAEITQIKAKHFNFDDLTDN